MKKILSILLGIILLSSLALAASDFTDAYEEIGFGCAGAHYSHFHTYIENKTNNTITFTLIDAGKSGKFGFGAKSTNPKIVIAPNARISPDICWKLNPAYKSDVNYVGVALDGFRPINNTPYFIKFYTSREIYGRVFPNFWHTAQTERTGTLKYANYDLDVYNLCFTIKPKTN